MSWEAAVRSLVDDPSQAELVRQCYFDRPLLDAARRFHASNEWESVRRRFRGRAGRALDVGAGNGIVSFALANDGWDVTAIEPDPSALVGAAAIRSLAEASGLPIKVVEGVADQLDAPPGYFDGIFVRQVFHHAPDIEAFARQLAQLLAPGGIIVTWRDHVISRPEDLPAFFDRHPLHHKYGGENAFMLTQYRGALEAAGLTVVETLRHFDDAMNFGPQSPAELLAEAGRRLLPSRVANTVAAVLGSRPVFPLLAPLLSATDRRPGRHVAFVATKLA